MTQSPLPINVNVNLAKPTPSVAARRPSNAPASPGPRRVAGVDNNNPEFHQENAVLGLSLENYVRRTPNEDGTHVVMIEHKEWIEKIKKPLTPEEKAEKAEAAKLKAKNEARIAFGVGLAVVAGIGGLVYFDWRSNGAKALGDVVKTQTAKAIVKDTAADVVDATS